MSKFTFKKWLFVGENFDARGLIEKITGETLNNPTLDDLQNSIMKKLKDERFLIVLDDVWSEKNEEWRQLWDPLTHNQRGSRVIVTARSRKVVDAVSPVFSEPLQILSDEDSWLIFENWAFADGNSNACPDLKEIGQEIVKKLKGIPLAARIVGSSLCNKGMESWSSILDSKAWPLSQDGNEETILPILQLSYQHLPLHLKQCFAFCSIFSKDEEFDKESLVHMWMAQGFIKPQGDKRIELVGSEYFDDLLHRSFFQYVEGRYVMHDLIHDLTGAVSDGEYLRIEGKKSFTIPEGIRHLCISDPDEGIELESLSKAKKIRTLIYHGWPYEQKMPTHFLELLNKLKCLRVLVLSEIPIKELPDSSWDLKHLRYLELFLTGKEQLPESLCKLYNLQTLVVVMDRVSVCALPEGMSKLVNLRHLNANDYTISKIAGIGKLTSLQELISFGVTNETGHKIDELKGMIQLRGKLHIRNIENVGSKEEAVQAQLETKKHLEELVLSYYDEYEDAIDQIDKKDDATNQMDMRLQEEVLEECFEDATDGMDIIRLQEEVLEALRPPKKLRKLVIQGYCGARLPSLRHLRFLKCFRIEGCRALTSLSSLLGHHELSSLQELEIVDCEELVSLWETEEEVRRFGGGVGVATKGGGYLVSLETLTIVWCPKLHIWAEEMAAALAHLTSLSKLVITGCPRALTSLPGEARHLSKLSDLTLVGCEELESLLGLQNLLLVNSSLRRLYVGGCPKLNVRRLSLSSSSLLDSSSSSPPVRHLKYLETDNAGLLAWILLLPRRYESLEELRFRECQEAITIFKIGDREEEGWWRSFPSLRYIHISYCKNLRSLPEGLHGLSSLTKLILYECPHIQRLPDRGLPPSLEELRIFGCPMLEDRCRRPKNVKQWDPHSTTTPPPPPPPGESGLDWPKIAHIPYVRINYETYHHQKTHRRRMQ